jgi:tetratricopeptide (TPR) repeat protein
MMKGFLRPFLVSVGLIMCVGLIGYSWLIFRMSQGVLAARQGETEKAVASFDSAERPFRAVPWLARVLRADYEKLIFDQVRVLSTQGDPELIFDKFEEAMRHSPSIKDQGEFAFWMGNLLVHRAAASRDGEEALRYLKSAVAEYQRGLVAAPQDWDLKYNYELVSRLFAQQQREMKAKGEKVKSILDTTRPPAAKKQQIAPEKLG